MGLEINILDKSLYDFHNQVKLETLFMANHIIHRLKDKGFKLIVKTDEHMFYDHENNLRKVERSITIKSEFGEYNIIDLDPPQIIFIPNNKVEFLEFNFMEAK